MKMPLSSYLGKVSYLLDSRLSKDEYTIAVASYKNNMPADECADLIFYKWIHANQLESDD